MSNRAILPGIGYDLVLMKIIFPEDPLHKGLPDEMYQPEARAAEAAGFAWEIVNSGSFWQQARYCEGFRQIAKALLDGGLLYTGCVRS